MRGLFFLCSLLSLAASAPLSTPSTSIESRFNLNALLFALSEIPCLGGPLQEITELLTASLEAIATLTGAQTTQNGMSSGSCADMMVIFARGTSEPGNVGLVVGPTFFNALKSSMGGASVIMQGVNYPADVPGFLAGGDPGGVQTLISLVNQAMTGCPSSKIVLVGYSQGAQLVHKAATLLPADTMANLSSVVIFGDPNNGNAVFGMEVSKSMVVCHSGDDICLHGDMVFVPHLTYSTEAAQAAAFVAANAKSH